MTPEKKSYPGACLSILGAVATWIAMAEIVKDTENKSDYNKPTFTVYVTHSSYILALPFYWLLGKYYFKHKAEELEQDCGERATFQWGMRKKFIKMTIMFNYLSILCGWTWYLSLNRTWVGTNTAIYNTNCALVYVFALCLGMATFDKIKFAAVVVMTGGVFLISLAPRKKSDDGEEHNDTVLGIIYVILSVLSFAVFEILYEKHGDICWDIELLPVTDARSGSFDQLDIESPTTRSDTPLSGGDDLNDRSSEDDDIYYQHQTTQPRMMHNAVSNEDLPINNHFQLGSDSDYSLEGDFEGRRDIHESIKAILRTVSFLVAQGILTLITIWPVLLLFHFTGIEKFEAPHGAALTSLLVTASLEILYQIFQLSALVWSSAVFVAVGLLITMPLSVLSDIIFSDHTPTLQAVFGMTTIGAGFLMSNIRTCYNIKKAAKSGKLDFSS